MVSRMTEGASEGGRWGLTGEQPVEMRRYLGALRRSWLFIAVFVIAITAVAIIGSSLATKKYRATATIIQGGSSVLDSSSNPDTIDRQLETNRRLLRTNDVLDLAATKLRGQTRDSLFGSISSSVDPTANIINISATNGNARTSAAIANAVAVSFLTTVSRAETQGITNALANLNEQLSRLRAAGAATEETQAVRDRITELVIARASIGTDLRLAQPADVPTKPYTPRPVRNGVIAFFAATFLAILIAIGRDFLRPRISETRELAQLVGLPVLARVPLHRGRFGKQTAVANAVATEAYQTLQASIRYAHQEGHKIVVVTSALEKEGKTTTSIGLAQALARSGRRTLLICADFRLPTLHERLGIKRAPGLSDLLRTASSPASVVKDVRRVTRRVTGFGAGSLDVIPSGSRVANPAELLFGGPFDTLLAALGLLDYDYVVIDGPPLLGIADGYALVQRADSVILSARPDRLTVEQAVEVREKLEQLHANTLGLVVCGNFANADAYGYHYAQASLGRTGTKGDEASPMVDENGSSEGLIGDSPARRTSASRRPR
jgi:capsular exopolysaccharide synthesis family protein